MYFTGACMIAFFTIEYIVVTLIFKAYKPKKAVAEVEMQAPPAFNPVQRKNLIVIVVVLLLLLVPTLTQAFFPNPVSKTLSNVFSMQVLWTGGALLLALIGCGNLKEVLTKRVPWDTIMLVMGMSVLFGMAKDMGVIDLMNIVLNKVPAWSIVPTLASICAVLSLFVSGSIITPMFVSMAETFSTITGVSLNVIIMAITGGAFVSSISPVSAGGAAALLGCDDENIRPRLIKLQTATALINIVLVFPFVLLVSKLF